MPGPRNLVLSGSFLGCTLLLSAALLFPRPSSAQQVMDNDAIVRLTEAGLNEDIIIQTINAQPGHYATGAGDLITLKQDGVSEKVIAAMINKASAASGANGAGVVTSPAASFAGVDEIGVYYKKENSKADKWTAIEPEIVNYKSGGWVKSTVTQGIIKEDRNGHIDGNASQLVLSRGTSFLLYVPDGVSPVEYQLLRLRINSNNREFRSQTGGVFHSSTGAQRDNVNFTAEKLAPRIYRFTLGHDAAKGEYGILPPGMINAPNASRAGKIYTFAIIE
ncbi:hypothetical protein [Edaphobacter bradus]|uniref:hypothetical protein n=1 Tax=Edaphobacter bradus TaxID=2259016 RepID=UPI0021E0AF0A|nr:hypothetical protein [Edaphobacter bradus]